MKRILGLLALVFVLAACGTEPHQPSISELNAEVLELHDSAMVKTDAIYLQISELRKVEKAIQRDSVDSSTSSPIDSSDADILRNVAEAIEMLEAADEKMMQWMRDYSPPDKKDTEEESRQRLKKFKANIILVDILMEESIENAAALLRKIQSQ